MDLQTAFTKLLDREGRTLSLDPYDPGNWTGGVCHVGVLKGSKYGVAAAAHPDVDIANLTEQAAMEIYDQEYWRPIQGGRLPDPVAYQMFDVAVQSGPKTAIKMLQTALGVSVDGILGSGTMAAVQAMKPLMLAVRMCAAMLQFYTTLPNWPAEGKGWTRRVVQNLKLFDPYLA